MAIVIDSSVFIALERRIRSGENDRTTLDLGETGFMASITASELLVGALRAHPKARQQERRALVEAFIEQAEILPLDLSVARVHAQLAAHMTQIGQMIGANDSIIAATALAYGYDVLTENIRHFDRVPGLSVRQPEW